MWRIYGSKSDYQHASKLEALKQWLRYQAEQQYEAEKEQKQREELERKTNG